MIPVAGVIVVGGYTFFVSWLVFIFGRDVPNNIQRDSLTFIY